jgi:hypothetical protein
MFRLPTLATSATLRGGSAEEVQEIEDDAGEEEAAGDDTLASSTPANPQTIFLEYLKSPMVHLVVGTGDEETTLTAHKAILEQSAHFADQLAGTSDDALQLDLPDESLDAAGCFLQYQYTGEYFPRCLPNAPDGLESDPSVPAIDNTGAQLLKHARVYTLAQKFGVARA